MVNVELFTFSKKLKSTAIPSNSGTILACNLKASTDILNPTLELKMDNNPINFNYAYIEDFNRYYFINNWTYDRGLWLADLTNDHLASARTYIGNSDLYVLRASAESDGNIIDTLYPTTIGRTYSRTLASVEKSETYSLNGGTYVLGVASADASVGSTTSFYCMTPENFVLLKQYFYNNFNGYTDDIIREVGDAVTKALFNPIDYIVSCTWYPIPITAIRPSGTPTTTTGIKMAWFNLAPTGFSAYLLGTNTDVAPFIASNSYVFVIPKHPLTSTKGNYVNASPFSDYILRCYPFGDINIDGASLSNYNRLLGSVDIDLITSKALLKLSAYNDGDTDISNNIIGSYQATYGVPISLSQQNTDILGVAQGISDIVMGTISVNSGMPEGAIGFDQVGRGIGTSIRSVFNTNNSTSGISGGVINFYEVKSLYGIFKDIVDDNNSDNGRPLCKVRKPSNLGGYMMVEKGNIVAPLTNIELEAIKSDLESGFYYE